MPTATVQLHRHALALAHHGADGEPDYKETDEHNSQKYYRHTFVNSLDVPTKFVKVGRERSIGEVDE